MKTINKIHFTFFLVLLFLIASFEPVFSEVSLPIEPKIKSVIVYPDRAIVKREVSVSIKKGNQTLVFKSASPGLNPESLTAYCSNKNIVIRGINTFTEKKTSSLNPQIRKLENDIYQNKKKLQKIRLEKKRLNTDLLGIDGFLKYLKKSINDSSKSKNNHQFKNWNVAREFLSKRRLNIVTEKLLLDQKIRKNASKSQFLKSNLDKIRFEKNKIRRIVKIQIQAKENTTALVGLSYMMKNTSWNVSYGMHLINGVLQVEYYGNIVQKSGEDWNNIKLSLSTSNPARGISRTKINPLLISSRKVETKTQYIQSEEISDEEENDNDNFSTSNIANNVVLDKKFEPMIFKVPGKTNIKSGARSIRVRISSFKIKPDSFYYRIVPTLNNTAHYSLKAKNNQNYPMLAGSVAMFRKSGFVGRSSFLHTAPGGKFQLSFGSDHTVAIDRKVIQKQVNEGLLTSQKAFITDSSCLITNESNKKVMIEYFERVPVSQTENVQVQIMDETTPTHQETKKRSGILKWTKVLQPGQSITIRLRYKVSVPEGFNGSIYGK